MGGPDEPDRENRLEIEKRNRETSSKSMARGQTLGWSPETVMSQLGGDARDVTLLPLQGTDRCRGKF